MYKLIILFLLFGCLLFAHKYEKPNKVHLTTENGVEYVSYNLGKTWTKINNAVNKVLSDTEDGKYISYDMGKSWQIVEKYKTIHNNNQLHIFPQPASSNINIEMKNQVKIRNIFLYNLDGILISRFTNINNYQFNISTEEFSPGQYFIKVYFDNKVAVQKLQISK